MGDWRRSDCVREPGSSNPPGRQKASAADSFGALNRQVPMSARLTGPTLETHSPLRSQGSSRCRPLEPACTCPFGLRLLVHVAYWVSRWSDCRRSLEELDRYLDKAAGQLVVQKYVETPALLAQPLLDPAAKPLCRPPVKFDVRQWVLVTGWAPRRVWIYDEALLRLSSKPYTLVQSDLGDRYVHLCNSAVQVRSSVSSNRFVFFPVERLTSQRVCVFRIANTT